jgi:acetylornithine deacetylase/succinyl-diaminopimelate desuccinylase-like protein
MTLLSDIVKISQTPAPTFEEGERADLLEHRFREEGVDNVRKDPEGNVVAQIKNRDVPAVCLTAHLDTVFDRSVNHTVHIDDRRITGPSVGDDSLGLATLLAVIRLLSPEDVGHLICVATTGTEGDGNLRGTRYFVDHSRTDIGFAYCLEGHKLGRIDHWSLGNNRIRIQVESRGGHVWRDRKKTGENPIEVIGLLINRLRKIEDDIQRDDEISFINCGMVDGGTAYNTVPYESELNVEIRSTNSDLLEQMFNEIFNTVETISDETDVNINVKEVTRRPVTGIEGDHWLVTSMEDLHSRLEIPSIKGPASSDSCIFLNEGIPTLTLGLARGENKHRTNESLEIDSLEAGQLQVLAGVLEGIDARPQEAVKAAEA